MTPFVPQIQERLARKNHTLGEFIPTLCDLILCKLFP